MRGFRQGFESERTCVLVARVTTSIAGYTWSGGGEPGDVPSELFSSRDVIWCGDETFVSVPIVKGGAVRSRFDVRVSSIWVASEATSGDNGVAHEAST